MSTQASSTGRWAGLAAALWAARHALPFVCVGACAGLLHGGLVRADDAGLAASCSCAGVMAALILREILLARAERTRSATRALVEVRILAPAAAILELGAWTARSAGLELGAVLYMFALISTTFFSRSASVPALVLVLALEWVEGGGPFHLAGDEPSRRLAFSLFLTFFGTFGLAFLRTEILRIRAKGKERLDDEIRSITDRARDFRLLDAPCSSVDTSEGPSGAEEDQRQEVLSLASALDEIHSTIATHLDVVRTTMKLNTCVLLWKDGPGEYLKVIEAASSAAMASPIPIRFGLTGAVVAHGRPVKICPLPPDTALPYYAEPEEVHSFCAVPVAEGTIVRGVLCADRLTEDPFSDEECEVLERLADQSVRIVANERLFLQLVKTKTEQTRLYRASTLLRAAHATDEVLDASFESARSFVPWDLAAATAYDHRSRRHKVVLARGEWADQVEGIEWKDNEGLVSQVVRMGYYLPFRGQYDAENQVVATKKVRLREARSLLVLPLVAQDRAIGTLVIASRREGVFTQQIRLLLQVVADQTALSFQNALMVRRLEEMATTDALTGLFNKRVFLEALGRHLREALRYGRPLSLIMTDLDHFKSVNDTHGHPVGDQVLVRFAEVLRRNTREVDVVCRCGGEEFAVIVVETDREGSLRMAERIRSDMEMETVEAGSAAVKVTCSIGLATCPEHGPTAEDLVRSADDALYEAKRDGRNRIVSATRRYLEAG